MDLRKAAKKAAASARSSAEELLGEDGIAHLKSLKDDLADAGDQVADFAREVREDCDNDFLRETRGFYANAAKKAQKELQIKQAQTQRQLQQKRAEREKLRRQMQKERERMMKRAFAVLVVIILVTVLMLSAALWFAQNRGGRASAPTPGTTYAAETGNSLPISAGYEKQLADSTACKLFFVTRISSANRLGREA